MSFGWSSSFLGILADLLSFVNPGLFSVPPPDLVHWIVLGAAFLFFYSFVLPLFASLMGQSGVLIALAVAFCGAVGFVLVQIEGAPTTGDLSFLGFIAMIVRLFDGMGCGFALRGNGWSRTADRRPVILGFGVYVFAMMAAITEHQIPPWAWVMVALSAPACFLSLIGVASFVRNAWPDPLMAYGATALIACSFIIGPEGASDLNRLCFYLMFPGGLLLGLVLKSPYRD